MKTIRPHIVLDLVGDDERRVNVMLPNKSSDNLILETMIILALEKTVSPQKVFEFGTYLGETTLHLAMNCAEGGSVFTLDLCVADVDKIDLDQRERALAERAVDNEPCFVSEAESERITRITGDSQTIDLSEHFGTCQFVYVDGGHAKDVIRSDTENAFKLLKQGEPSVIVWHDYGNPNYPDVKEYLDALSDSIPIFSVADTRIAFHGKALKL